MKKKKRSLTGKWLVVYSNTVFFHLSVVLSRNLLKFSLMPITFLTIV